MIGKDRKKKKQKTARHKKLRSILPKKSMHYFTTEPLIYHGFSKPTFTNCNLVAIENDDSHKG